MFGNRAFTSWPLVFIGAALFSGFFMILLLMTGAVLEEPVDSLSSVLSFGAVAFIGYVGVAFILRQDTAE